MVDGKGKGVELMGMDLQTDPYVVESEGENDDLFGDNSGGAVPADDGIVERASPRVPK